MMTLSRSKTVLIILACATALFVAGCGGSDSKSDSPKSDSSSSSSSDSASKDPAFDKSRSLFTTSCGGCHQLADADAVGSVGPDLDKLKMTKETVLAQIKNGGGGMPADLIKGDDAEQMAEYVAAVSKASK